MRVRYKLYCRRFKGLIAIAQRTLFFPSRIVQYNLRIWWNNFQEIRQWYLESNGCSVVAQK